MMILVLLLMSTTLIQAKACIPGKRIFHPADCSKYLECDLVTEEETIKTCPEKKVFSPTLGMCIDSDDSCVSRDRRCEFEDLRPNPYDCYSFLQCAHGNIYVIHCPPGLMFNPKEQVCDYPESVNCVPTSTTKEPTTTTQNDLPTDLLPPSTTTERSTTESSATESSATEETIFSPCRDVGTMANPEDPSGESYIECTADPSCPLHHDVVQCSERKIYDPQIGGCWYNCTNVPADKVYIICGHISCPTPAACHGDKKWTVQGSDNCWFFKQCLQFPSVDEIHHLPSWNPLDRLNGNKWRLCEFECPRVNNVRWAFDPRQEDCQAPPISDICPQWLSISRM